MKQVFTLIAVTAVAAGLALAQMPGHDCQEGGKRIEKREVRMIKGDGPGMGMGMRGQWWENPEVCKELALTDKQAGDIDALAMQHRKEMIKSGADLKIKQLELHDMIGENAKDAEIKAKAKEVFQLKQKLHDARLDHMLAVRRVLTGEQQAKLKAMKGRLHGHRGMMMDCKGDGDCCPK
ncbi:MAG: Spy/CpxP family protein refolding chaperone [Candidatus Edwardsbacteria bacterium]|jgi:Spy/CpxP family protein refolding chaperone|nr:Spy/CpxP family protein refolding chaperone [Candidatus Edwardsbacteria bacterium]